MKPQKIILLVVVLSASIETSAQFLFNPNHYKIRQNKESTGGSKEKWQLMKGQTNVLYEINAEDVGTKEKTFGELDPLPASDAVTEIDNVRKLYSSGNSKAGWRKKINATDLAKLTTDNTTAYITVISRRRETRGVKPQILSGLYQKLDNNLGENASNFFELGSRISDLRVKLNTKLKYTLEEKSGNYTLTRSQKERFLYFDFISRGVIALDSLSTTVNEYINSLQGSPLSIRMTQQINLSNPIRSEITKQPEPLYYLDFAFDARLVPVTLGNQITSAGGSFHFIPSFTAAFPSGKADDPGERDRIVVQITGNLAYITSNAAEILFLGQEETDRVSFSFEARVGLFSEDVPTRNFNFLFRYNAEPVNGARSVLGFTFAPQVSKEK